MTALSHTTRRVTDGDADAVARLLTDLGHPTNAVDVPHRLREVIAEGGAAFLQVDEAGRALGMFSVARHAVLHAAGPVGLITSLVVAEDARRLGVGRAMVAAAQAWARDAGCVRLVVTSGEQRPDAHSFYPACGMLYTGRRFSITLK